MSLCSGIYGYGTGGNQYCGISFSFHSHGWACTNKSPKTMACNCTTYTCLELAPRIVQCDELILTTLVANQTGTWLMKYEFNGSWFGEEIDVTTGQYIELPFVFNENYNHTIEFYNTSDTLFNDTCYTLDTSKILGSPSTSSATSPSSGGGFAYDTVTAEAGDSVTMNAIGTAILLFDGNQSYTADKFTQVGAVITMTNGVLFYDGQQVTILYV